MKTKKKKPTYSKLDEKLWKVFSEYVRRRYADENGIVKCFTCGKTEHWKGMQAGHFISRKHKATKYHELNVRPQCVSCNIFRQGEQFIFGRNLDEIYGSGTAEKIEQESRMICKRDAIDLKQMIDYYIQKIKEL
jgi:hypothetical protein